MNVRTPTLVLAIIIPTGALAWDPAPHYIESPNQPLACCDQHRHPRPQRFETDNAARLRRQQEREDDRRWGERPRQRPRCCEDR